MSDPNYGKRAAYLQKVKRETRKKINLLWKQGIKEVGTLTEREFWVAGLSLYWAEGFKKDRQLGFSNIDPKMIIFFIIWLKKCLGIKEGDIKLRVTINESQVHRARDIEKYWSRKTGIPLSNFQKPIVQRVKWKKKYQNEKKYKGVLRIRVSKSLSHLRKMFGSIEGLYLKSLDVK